MKKQGIPVAFLKKKTETNYLCVGRWSFVLFFSLGTITSEGHTEQRHLTIVLQDKIWRPKSSEGKEKVLQDDLNEDAQNESLKKNAAAFKFLPLVNLERLCPVSILPFKSFFSSLQGHPLTMACVCLVTVEIINSW